MIYNPSHLAVAVFVIFVGITLALSFYFAGRTRSAAGYFAAGGNIHWFVNGIAFAGDYLSAASFLGICGMIAFSGYDGFLYSIGFLAGWVVALFVIAEPLKRLGRYTFADALDSRFQSPWIKLAAGTSALVVSILYLIPQMVGAGVLIKPLLGFGHCPGSDDRRGRGGADRGDGRHGLDHVRPVSQRVAAGHLQRDLDRADPAAQASRWTPASPTASRASWCSKFRWPTPH